MRAGGTYTYRVQAINDAGVSGWSNEATITLALPPQPPAAPTNLTAVAFSATEIGLIWKDNSSDESVFGVYRRGPGSADFVKLADVTANSTSYLDRGLRPGTAYHYLVRTWNPTGGASRASNEAIATTRPAQ